MKQNIIEYSTELAELRTSFQYVGGAVGIAIGIMLIIAALPLTMMLVDNLETTYYNKKKLTRKDIIKNIFIVIAITLVWVVPLVLMGLSSWSVNNINTKIYRLENILKTIRDITHEFR